jgi:DNA-binding NtrC family response regulator
MAHILVVDDEVGIRELLSEILVDEGHQVTLADSAGEARRQRERQRPDMVLLDIWMPDTDGITLLKEWAASGQLTMPVVMMSGHGTIETAVEATRIGALDFLEKPIALQRLLLTVKHALHNAESAAAPRLGLAALGRSPALAETKKRLSQLAQSSAALLLRGERGIRPELFAQLLAAPGAPFVAGVERAEFFSCRISAGWRAASSASWSFCSAAPRNTRSVSSHSHPSICGYLPRSTNSIRIWAQGWRNSRSSCRRYAI